MSEDESLKDNESMGISITDNPEIQMYKDYLRHMSAQDIAKKYDMSIPNVYHIAKVNKWKEKRNKAKLLAYKKLDKKYKEQIVDIVSFLEREVHLIMDSCLHDKRQMRESELELLLRLLDKYTKESKLSDGTPTEITGGSQIVHHVVIQKPEAKRFGVIPPDPKVIQIEASAVEPTKTEENINVDEETDDFE